MIDKTLEEYEFDVYIYYLQSAYSSLYVWDKFIELAKSNYTIRQQVESAIGYTYEEIINKEKTSNDIQ